MSYPYVQARWLQRGRIKTPRLIVIHDMEAPEFNTTAERTARYFQVIDRKASAHYCVDADSIVECVHPDDTAFHAAGANADGIGIEHAGYARQSMDEWLDPYGRAMLARSAVLIRELCKRYGIAPRRLSVAEVADGRTSGLCGHGDVSEAFPAVSTGHYDPGSGFPWAVFLHMINEREDKHVFRTFIRGTSGPEEAWIPGRGSVILNNQDEKNWLISAGFVLPGEVLHLAPDDAQRWFGTPIPGK